MKKTLLFILIIFFIYSCVNEKNSERGLLDIPIYIDQKKIPFPFAEITEREITAIELELTDESIIGGIHQVVFCNDNIIIAGYRSVEILVFGMDGKFIRKIKYKGQGPGELVSLDKIAIDEKKNCLYLTGNKKVVCYDLTGKFLKEFTSLQNENFAFTAMNFMNGELLLLGDKHVIDERGYLKQSVIYTLNDELQLVDSCIVRNVYVEGFQFYSPYFDLDNYLSNMDSTIYLYCPEFLPRTEVPEFLRDTLYRLENNQLIPELKLKFNYSDNRLLAGKNFRIQNIFRSSRYVFVVYAAGTDRLAKNLYCYDLMAGEGYNVDISVDFDKIEEEIIIRHINNRADLFYYTLIHIKPDDREEPNPTLYIVRLKQLHD